MTLAYRYPDPDDLIPALGKRDMPNAVTDGQLLAQAVEQLPARPRQVVDVGAGDGRLLEYFAGFADEITLVEPDGRRLDRARLRADRLPATEVTFFEQDAATFAAGHTSRFDLVVCSHVVQHVSRRQRSRLFVALGALVAARGHLLLTFPAVDGGRPRYLLSSCPPGRTAVSTVAVTPDRFDQAAEALSRAQGHARSAPLPVWQPPANLIVHALRRTGLQARWTRAYRPFVFTLDHRAGTGAMRAAATDTAVLAVPHRDAAQ